MSHIITSLPNVELFGFLSHCFTFSSSNPRYKAFIKLYILSERYINLNAISSTLTRYLRSSFCFPEHVSFHLLQGSLHF